MSRSPTIELFTNEQLIDELLRRSTFRGVIVYQKENFKGPCLDDWRYEARNCDPIEVIEGVLPQIREQTA